MIHDRERCREASRRIRDDLIHLSIVDPGHEIQLADGARASVGDLIICRENNHAVNAGERGRSLANGDTLRIEAIRDGAAIVHRALDCDPRTGARRWTDRASIYTGYDTADLGYAVTGHGAQGRTVRVGLSLLTGNGDRQWLYVAMTRGTEKNAAIALTRPARLAEPEAGTRPAPELARHDQLTRQRTGLPATAAPPGHSPEPRDAIAVAADILGRNGSHTSATDTRKQALSNADHLAILNAMWQGETTRLHNDRYRELVLAELPPQHAADGLTSPQATWLWRTLRAAEHVGLDLRETLRQAMAARSLTGAQDLASVLDYRLRQLVGPLVPQPPPPWSARVPEVSDPEQQRFLTELGAAMDARKDRHRGQQEIASRHELLGRSWTAMAAFYREQETELEQTMQTRQVWERATEQTRRRAIAADSELRRRNPARRPEPLRSAEPFVTEEERAQLNLEPGVPEYTTPEWITELAAERRSVRDVLDQRKADNVRATEVDFGRAADAWASWIPDWQDAVLQPPKPEMPPSRAVLSRAAELEAER